MKQGFTKIPQWIFDEDISPTEFRVLMVLFSYLPKIFPSLETIAKRSRISRRTAIRSIQALEKSNLIIKEIREGKSTLYKVRLMKKGSSTSDMDDTSISDIGDTNQCQP